nr:serine hydrolase domain-containing protein [Kofleriaceae bacterium]
MRALAVVVIVAAAACSHPHVKARAKPSVEVGSNGPLDAAVRDAVTGVPGAQVVVMRGGKTQLARAYGYASLEEHRKMTLDSTARIGGLTEAFTAVATMQLTALGRLHLDDSVHGYLDLPDADDAVTIRRLLAHQSGLHDYFDLVAKADGNLDRSPTAVFELIAAEPLDFDPGARTERSSSDYYVLGLLIERVTHEPLDTYLRDHVVGDATGPLTHLCGKSDAVGYTTGPAGDPIAEPQLSEAAGFAASGACSTAPELARWFDAFVHGRIVAAPVVAELTASAAGEIHGHRKLAFTGQLDGFSATASYLPEIDTTYVVIANSCCSAAGLVDTRLTRALLPDVPPS